MSIHVRRVDPTDPAAFRTVASQFKRAAVSAAHADRFLSNPANYLIVAETEEAIAGFVLAYRLDRLDREAAQLFVYEVDVAPAFRRRGIGTSLMAFVRHIVSAEDMMEAFVVADEANQSAVALYRRSGALREGGPAAVFVYPGAAT